MPLLLPFDPESQESLSGQVKQAYLQEFMKDDWKIGIMFATKLLENQFFMDHKRFGSSENLVQRFLGILKEADNTSLLRALVDPLRKQGPDDAGPKTWAKHHDDPYLDAYSVQAVRANDDEEIDDLDLHEFREDLKLLVGRYHRTRVRNPLSKEGDVNDLIAANIMMPCSVAISAMLENWWDRYAHARPQRFQEDCPYVMPRAQHSGTRWSHDKGGFITSVVDHSFVLGDELDNVLVFVEDKRARAVHTTDIEPFTRPAGYKNLVDKALNPKGVLTERSKEGIAVFGQQISVIGSHSENMQSHMRQAVEYSHVFSTDYAMLTDGLTGIPMIWRDNKVRKEGIHGDVAKQFLSWDVGDGTHGDSAGISVLYLLWRRLRDEGCFYRDFPHEPARRSVDSIVPGAP